MTKRERLNNIQTVLEENLQLKWVDRLIYNPANNFYRTAELFDFADNTITYVYLQNNKHKAFRARVLLNKEKFIIRMNGMEIDVSEHWQELSSPKLVTALVK